MVGYERVCYKTEESCRPGRTCAWWFGSRSERRSDRMKRTRPTVHAWCSRGRRCHCTPPLAAVGCHSLGIYKVILLPLHVMFCHNDSVAPAG